MNRNVIALAFAFSFTAYSVAEIGPKAFGPATKLIYVGPTELTSETGMRSLCVQVEDQHALFVAHQRTVSGYVLSSTDCTTDKVTPVGQAAVPRLKQASLLPASIPDVPSAPLFNAFKAQIVILIFALSFCFLPWTSKWRISPRSRRMRQVSGDPMYFEALLSVLFHVARTNGTVGKQDLETIHAVYEDYTGTKVTTEMVASQFARFSTEANILALVQDYRGPQAELLLDAAIHVAASTGEIPAEKQAFLEAMNARLDRGPHWLEQALDAAQNAGPDRPAQGVTL